jgi:hypothetical protein
VLLGLAARAIALAREARRGEPDGGTALHIGLATHRRHHDPTPARLQGHSLELIGDSQQPHISPQRVHQIITQYPAETATSATKEVRRLELMRLDEIQANVYENAVMAIDRVLAIHDRRAKRTGINAQDLWRIHGLKVNHKHVRRLTREDNLLCLRAKLFVPYTTNSRHEFPIVPNLVRGLVPTGIDQI